MRAFGFVSVSGRSLVPNPAAKIMAFMGKKCLKCPKCLECLKLKNINAGVLEKWSDGVLGLNHYSNAPLLQALKCAIMPKVSDE
jgi:hypothetical protein